MLYTCVKLTEIFLKNPPLLHNPIKYYQLNTNEEFQSRSLKNKNSRIDTRDYFIDLNNLSEQKTEKNYYGTSNMTLSNKLCYLPGTNMKNISENSNNNNTDCECLKQSFG